ncbi:Epidermal growth factor receptor kinase substrate 8-like protein 3 [Merluccius polli]|uniref:Epidermal growth factor receptor kinase substrate 8-like protein 3 n=1 Tax=Merluccius polli TaxID=89951 RepID=A0AA47P393_MERPO|nr:Epidermal growth factor receptor kinase substrate 8-like protein 3 [Merluccius polli]
MLFNSGFAPEDQSPLRRSVQQDEPRNTPWQRNSTSRPSGKTIYTQRKEHIETLNKQDNIHYRVEHLFTCELNGHEASSLSDCVAKLKKLDAKGRLWPQDMILDVQGGYLQLNDVETKGLAGLRGGLTAGGSSSEGLEQPSVGPPLHQGDDAQSPPGAWGLGLLFWLAEAWLDLTAPGWIRGG